MNGQLREHPLAELIREIVAANLPGALRLSLERVRAMIFMGDGEIVLARSNLRAHRLDESLKRWGVIAEDVSARVLSGATSDAEVGAALVSGGVCDEQALAQYRAWQTADVLRPLLLLTDGEWSFDPRMRLSGEEPVKFELHELLLEGGRRLPPAFAASRLSDDEELISPVPEMPAHLQLLPVEGFVISRVETPLRLRELIAISGLPDEQTRHTVYALMLGGLLRRACEPRAFTDESIQRMKSMPPVIVAAQANGGAPTTSASSSRETSADATLGAATTTVDPRTEIEALFACVRETNFYNILGVTRDAPPTEIKRVYYALAKRFHPDRFQRDADEATLSRIEGAFARIAQAYDTLKDERHRAAYDLKLKAQAAPTAPSPAAAPPASSAGAPPANKASNAQAPQSASAGATAKTQAPTTSAAPAASARRAEESFQQGLAASQQGNDKAAVVHFGEAARLAPDQARYRASYGRLLAREATTRRQAEAELQAAISLDNRNASYRVLLAELYRALGHKRRAVSELERALAIDPQHAVARDLLKALKGAERK